MTPDEFISLEENPNFIEGIYNYCDRWCERCPVTHKCLLYASTQPDESMKEGTAEKIRHAMMRQIEDSFEVTIDLLNKMDDEQNKNHPLRPTKASKIFRKRYDKKRQAKSSPLSRLAKAYLDKTHRWMANLDVAAKKKDEELFMAAVMQLPGRDPEKELEELKSALDVVNWYFFQINVKLTRAQMSREKDHQSHEENGFPKDSDGSAKVALIGIERSISAWDVLLYHMPDQEKPILELLSILQRLRRMTEEEFPKARSFKRAGLDD